MNDLEEKIILNEKKINSGSNASEIADKMKFFKKDISENSNEYFLSGIIF